jgi:hypothetical protein
VPKAFGIGGCFFEQANWQLAKDLLPFGFSQRKESNKQLQFFMELVGIQFGHYKFSKTII